MACAASQELERPGDTFVDMRLCATLRWVGVVYKRLNAVFQVLQDTLIHSKAKGGMLQFWFLRRNGLLVDQRSTAGHISYFMASQSKT